MTNAELAKALGVAVRTIERYRSEGMPLPAASESLADWRKRANAWRRDRRRLPGPRKRNVDGAPGREGGYLEEKRKLECAKIELELAELRGELHSSKECEAADAKRWAMVLDAIKVAGNRLARRCGNQDPSPEILQQAFEEEVSAMLEAMKRGQLDQRRVRS